VTARITVVIPTRNRAELAMAAASGLLAELGESGRVLVSDNSSDEEQGARLADFCERLGDRRLRYLRPPEMTMPAHWNWALGQALERDDSSHFSIHYDRKVPRPGQWRFLLDAIERRPDRVITYPIDQIIQQPPGWALWQTPWSGELVEIETARVRQMASQGRIAEMGHAWPILSNCITPREVLVGIAERFGDICDSTGPDAAFAFRFCALEDTYLHLDRALGTIYAIYRSNGAGYMSGKVTDFEDFKQMWKDRPWLDAAPLPGLDLGWNLLFHEYELVRREVGDARFPPLSSEGYLSGLAYGLAFIEDADQRAWYEELLQSHGWQRPAAPEPAAPGRSGHPGRRRLRSRIGGVVRSHAWLLDLAWRAGAIPEPNGFAFATEERALRFARRHQRSRTAHNALLDPLLGR
jgi:hypothetical protein